MVKAFLSKDVVSLIKQVSWTNLEGPQSGILPGTTKKGNGEEEGKHKLPPLGSGEDAASISAETSSSRSFSQSRTQRREQTIFLAEVWAVPPP